MGEERQRRMMADSDREIKPFKHSAVASTLRRKQVAELSKAGEHVIS